jgi:hypothetical protein
MPRRPMYLDNRSAEDLKKLQDRLHKYASRSVWDKKIQRELRGPIRNAERAVKLKILSIPSKGLSARQGRESLRRKIYRSVRTNVDTSAQYTGAFIWVDAYEMPTGEENLPAYMERVRRYTRWRKPVFGDREVWATQRAHPYFYRTLRPFQVEAAEVAEKTLDDMKRDVESK